MTARNIIPQSPHFCKPFLQKIQKKAAQKRPWVLLRRYYKLKLLQLALGLHALVVVQDLLADAQILRGNLQQLVLC